MRYETALLAGVLLSCGGLAVPVGAQGTAPATAPATAPFDPSRHIVEDYRRLAQFRAALKTAQDPVALALEAARQPYFETAVAALEVLAQHPENAQAERMLEEISKSDDRWSLGDGVLSWAGEAGVRLWDLRARREFNQLLAGAETPAQRWERLQAIFRAHPEWEKHNLQQSPETTRLVYLLLDEAERTGGDAAVDLVAPSGHISHAYAKTHGPALLAYAQKVGREKTMQCPYFLERLGESRIKDAAPLLQQWLQDAPPDEVRALMDALANTGGREPLTALLDDPRPAVYRAAANQLANHFPDEAAADAIDRLRAKLRATQADEKDLVAVGDARREILGRLRAQQRQQGQP